MLLGYVRPDARHPAQPQIDALVRFGVDAKRIYVEKDRRRGDAYPQIDAVAKACRSKSDQVVVADLHRIGSNVDDLATCAAKILKHGGAIVEARTGRIFTEAQTIQATVDAANFHAARGMSTEAARRIGTTGGERSPVTKPAQGRMPEAEARKIWTAKPDTETTTEALARINADTKYQREWTITTAWKRLGPRGSKPGRKANLDSG